MVNSSAASTADIRRDIARVLISTDQIAHRVGALAGEISHHYGRREVTIIAVLTGSLIFLADLIRSLPLMMRLDVVSVSSYPGVTTRSRGAELTLPPGDLSGRDILIVDDILDSGQTMSLLIQSISEMKPASLQSCVLPRKNRPDISGRVGVDFVGFDVADEFVVGYGLDYNHLYRNLPDICILTDDARSSSSGAGDNS